MQICVDCELFQMDNCSRCCCQRVWRLNTRGIYHLDLSTSWHLDNLMTQIRIIFVCLVVFHWLRESPCLKHPIQIVLCKIRSRQLSLILLFERHFICQSSIVGKQFIKFFSPNAHLRTQNHAAKLLLLEIWCDVRWGTRDLKWFLEKLILFHIWR